MSKFLAYVGYSTTEDPEFKKHLEAVKFCSERNLSYPKETRAFFAGAYGGDNLDDVQPERALQYIENGLEVDINDAVSRDADDDIMIDVSKLPPHVTKIRVKMDW